MRPWTAGIFTAIAGFTAAASAEAAAIPITSVTPTELFADFNVITDGTFNSTSDTAGPVLIGGNLGPGAAALNQTDVVLGTTTGTTAITGYGEVNVFGDQTAPFNNAMGTVLVGGTVSSSVPPFPGATAPQPTGGYAFPPGTSLANNPTTFSTYIWTPLTTVSSNLAALPANSTFNATTGVLTGVAGPNGAVFSIPLSTLSSFTGTLSLAGCLALSPPCDAVINVTGAGAFAAVFSFPTALESTGLPNVLFNFGSGITSVEWGDEYFDASILAVDAVAGNNGSSPLIGNLAADSVSATAAIGGEIHLPGFDCSDNLCASMPPGPPVGVPEPGSVVLLGSVFAVFAAMRRRSA